MTQRHPAGLPFLIVMTGALKSVNMATWPLKHPPGVVMFERLEPQPQNYPSTILLWEFPRRYSHLGGRIWCDHRIAPLGVFSGDMATWPLKHPPAVVRFARVEPQPHNYPSTILV